MPIQNSRTHETLSGSELLDKGKPPECCKQCRYLGLADCYEWESRPFPQCNIGVWLPYRKQACKRQASPQGQGDDR